jgi:hypothetical protein
MQSVVYCKRNMGGLTYCCRYPRIAALEADIGAYGSDRCFGEVSADHEVIAGIKRSVERWTGIAMASSPVSSRSLDSFYIAGGTLPLAASSYVVRQADTDLYESLLAGEYCCVLDSRGMGKSSLAVRTCARLKEQGIRTVLLDLSQIGSAADTPEQWYLHLLAEAGRDLDLHDEFHAYWQEHPEFTVLQRFLGALLLPIRDPAPAPLIVFIDAIDSVRSLSFHTDALFSAIGKCYLGRTDEPALKSLVFCLLGNALPADLISDTRTSPFQLGKRVEIHDFTAEEAAPLSQGLGENGNILLSRILYWTEGHPSLIPVSWNSLALVGTSCRYGSAIFTNRNPMITQ